MVVEYSKHTVSTFRTSTVELSVLELATTVSLTEVLKQSQSTAGTGTSVGDTGTCSTPVPHVQCIHQHAQYMSHPRTLVPLFAHQQICPCHRTARHVTNVHCHFIISQHCGNAPRCLMQELPCDYDEY